MATHDSVLAWDAPWTEEPGGLQSMGSQKVRHDLATEQQQQFGSLMENRHACSPTRQGSPPGWGEVGRTKSCSLDQTGYCVLLPGVLAVFLPASGLFSILQPDQDTKDTICWYLS